jgi:hypothetical protein
MGKQGPPGIATPSYEVFVRGSEWPIPTTIPSFMIEHSSDDCSKCRMYICVVYAELNPNPYRSKVVDLTFPKATLNTKMNC